MAQYVHFTLGKLCPGQAHPGAGGAAGLGDVLCWSFWLVMLGMARSAMLDFLLALVLPNEDDILILLEFLFHRGVSLSLAGLAPGGGEDELFGGVDGGICGLRCC